MAITRTFLDWTQPALPLVVNWLLGKYLTSQTVDMGNVCAIMPGSRAGRRLLELLVSAAQQRNLIFVPPTIATMGRLPELLYESKRPFANQWVQQLTWMQVLREMDTNATPLYLPRLPAEDDWVGWLGLARLLWRQHRELAGDGWDFEHVVAYGRRTPGFVETGRWRFLRQLQIAYLRKLDDCQLWDRQTARLYAIGHHECHTDNDIVLVATADMNRATRLMLDQVTDRVTALIFAPEALSSRFDEYGCIVPDAWVDVSIDLQDTQMKLVDGPAQQAEAVAKTMLGYGGYFRPDEITIGIPDDSIIPWIQNRLRQSGVTTRSAVGRSLTQTPIYRLLDAVENYLERSRVESFAALIRHPHVVDWLTKHLSLPPDYLIQFDEYYNEHLPPWLGTWLGPLVQHEKIKQVHAAINDWLQPLRSKSETREIRKLDAWSDVISNTLSRLYVGVVKERGDPALHAHLAASSQIRDVLLEMQDIPDNLSPPVTAPQAIRMMLDVLASLRIQLSTQEDAVELLGWLELPLDTSPALIVTSLNEQFVPESLDSDLFLPNQMRHELQLVDNTRRYARDAYALSALTNSRRQCDLIVARQDRDGNPLKPSRLLFATDRITIAHRAIKIFGPTRDAFDSLATGSEHPVKQPSDTWEGKPPADLECPVSTMSVTSFRSYLACPYRFYLRHVLGLKSVDDSHREMDAPRFGSLMHEVLCRFGRSEIHNAVEPDRIHHFLDDELTRCVRQWFGLERLAAVNIQIAQIRRRLEAFAHWQASWALQGWRILHTEVPSGNRHFPWTVDAGTIQLRGCIDRIDHNEQTGAWIIFDYKTSDRVSNPENTHRTGKKWIDLQLPLYRHLVQLLGIDAPISLAYLLLPKNTQQTGDAVARWSADDLRSADEKVDEVVAAILDEQFWPPASPPPRILTEYGALCNEGVFG